jgi:hypothetical protein
MHIGKKPLDSLGHDVRTAVPEDFSAALVLRCQNLDRGILRKGRRKIDPFPVHFGRERTLPKRRLIFEKLGNRRTGFDSLGSAV